MAERLRRQTWNLLGYSRTGSNPVRSEFFLVKKNFSHFFSKFEFFYSNFFKIEIIKSFVFFRQLENILDDLQMSMASCTYWDSNWHNWSHSSNRCHKMAPNEPIKHHHWTDSTQSCWQNSSFWPRWAGFFRVWNEWVYIRPE